MFVVWYPKQ